MAFDFSQGQAVSSKNPTTASFDFSSGKTTGGFEFAPKPATPQSPASNMLNDIGNNVKNIPKAFNGAVQGFGDAFAEAGTKIHNTLTGSKSGKLDTFGTMLKKTGDVAGAMGGAINQGIGSLASAPINGVANVLSDMPGVQTVSQGGGGPVGDVLSHFSQKLQDKVSQASQAHPEVANQVHNAVNVLAAALALQAGPKEITTGVTSILDKGVKIGGGIYEGAAKVGETVGSKISNTKATISGKTGSSVASYVDAQGNKVFTRLTPKELASVKDEINTIPEGNGKTSQIHLDAVDTKNPNYSKFGKEVGRDDFIKGHPQAADVFSNMEKNVVTKASSKELSKIQDTISPKLNAKETKVAVQEGRITRGKDSKIFGKQPDVVGPSANVQKAATTIKENIPGASKMNDVQLHEALDSHIEMTSKNLSGEMKNVPVKPESFNKINDSWKSLKSEQASSPEFLDNEAGNKAFQGKFENYLKQAQDSKNLDDIWSTRKAYDDSIPANVKQATEASSPTLQTRKSMWLDNRELLNSAINDTATGLGETSQKEFAKMTNMYTAKNNILSKAKIDVKGTAGGSKIGGFIKKHPYASGAIGIGATERILKGAGVPIP